MKKIISGKKYDTDTARKVGEWSTEFGRNDFHYVIEELYRKRTGEYFLYGEGGSLSKYAEPVGLNSWQGGCRLMPLSYDEALSWAERHLDVDEYEEEFGEVSESDDEVAVSFRITASAKAALDRECSRTGESRSAIVTTLLEGLTRNARQEASERLD